MIDRYSKKNILLNNLEEYKNIFRLRGIKFINQYSSPTFSYKNNANFSYFTHIWTIGDRYYKLSYEYYGDPNDWWIIALFNNKPTESDIILGESILIPTSPTEFISYLNF